MNEGAETHLEPEELPVGVNPDTIVSSDPEFKPPTGEHQRELGELVRDVVRKNIEEE